MDEPPGVLHLLYPDVESACQTWEKPRKFEDADIPPPFRSYSPTTGRTATDGSARGPGRFPYVPN